MSTATGAALVFAADTHEYRLPDGRLIPSVTQILRETGISVDFDEIAGLSHRIAVAVDLKRDIGTALHADAWAYDDDDLDWSTVDPRVLPYLRAWVTFRENTGVIPTTRERRVYDPALGVCGTLDGIFLAPNGNRVLADLKVGDPESAGARYQTAGYELLWLAEHADQPISERWSVQLTPDRVTPYRITPYRDWTDGQKFRAFVTTYYAQAARRKA